MKPPFLALLLLPLAACSGSSSDDPEVIGGLVVANSHHLPHAVSPDTRVAIGERWLVYLASEVDSNADLNLDLDLADRVAIAFDTKERSPVPLSAARDVAILGSNVYLVVAESEDGRDWSKDGDTDDVVLLHWSKAAGVTSLVVELEEAAVEVVGDWLYASRESSAPGIGLQTTLVSIRVGSPTVAFSAFAANFSTGPVLEVLGSDDGMLFLAQDESANGRDLNGDGDTLDDVLALVEANDPSATVKNVGLAIEDDAPFRANYLATDDWLVAFAVDEEAQGGLNLNFAPAFPVSWQPNQCIGFVDGDAQDEVLFVLNFRDWFLNDATSPPVNTGLTVDGRVFAVEHASSGRAFAGTLSYEEEAAGCPLNGDGDDDDRVVRWGEVVGNTFVPHTDVDEIVAVAPVEGGFRGVAEVSGRVLAVIAEDDDQRDWDMDAGDHDVLAWIDPFATDGWQVPRRTQDDVALGVGWMREHSSRRGLLFGDLESVLGRPCNAEENDTNDMFAVTGRFDPTDLDEFQWSGYCVAAESFNAGLEVVGSTAYFRASEAEEGRDFNEDGDMADDVLLRHRVFPVERLFYVDVLNALPTQAVFTGAADLVLFLVDEGMAGEDRNGDGDQLDHVLRWATTD